MSALRKIIDAADDKIAKASIETGEPITPYCSDDFRSGEIGLYEEIVPLIVTLANCADEVDALVDAVEACRFAVGVLGYANPDSRLLQDDVFAAHAALVAKLGGGK